MQPKRKPKTRPKARRTPRYSSLNPRQKATRERAINLLSDLRARKGPYNKLLRKHRLDSRTAHKYLGGNLIRGTDGRVRASKTDRLVRKLLFPMSFGDLPVLIHSSRQASKLSDFLNDRKKLVGNKRNARIAREFESKWRGVRIAGQEVFSNASEIFRMQNAGVLKLENLYASTSETR
jgi:hypothetical protein